MIERAQAPATQIANCEQALVAGTDAGAPGLVDARATGTPNDAAVPGAHRAARARRRSVLWQVQQCAAIAALAVGCYFLISRFLVQSVTVVGSSMTPTLAESERYLLNRWVFHVREPQRGDIVVIRDPLDNGYSVKRVVAVAGEAVAIREGSVFVNQQKLVEPYLAPGMATFAASGRSEQEFTCRSGCFFVLGDNRRNSVDSRIYGPVPRQSILGLVVR